MPVIDSTFQAPAFMANGHFQTLYPYFFRKVDDITFHRERLNLIDGDFVDIDIKDNGSDEVVILSHGLEGSSQAGYIKGMAKYLSQNNLADVVAWNMRSCSGELNKKPFFYHAASTGDLSQVVDYIKKRKNYKKVHLMGFSLGGNLTGFYASTMLEDKLSEVNSACIFSSTLDLASSIRKLNDSALGGFYKESFLVTMRKKALEKQSQGLLDIDPKKIKSCKTFIEFDEIVTAPTNGFETAHDYYSYASARRVIEKTAIPLLVVQAKDDPFLTKECFPLRTAARNPNVFLEITPSGGHVGFMTLDKKLEFWSERRAGEFIKNYA